MVVARRGNRNAQQILIFVHCLDDRSQEQQELCILARGLARFEQIFALVGRNRPVVVLTGTVNTVKRLFVHQADEAVLLRHALHDLHGQLVVVGCDVGGGEHRRHLVLSGRNLVVLGLGKDAELPQLLIQLLHECGNARTDRAEVVVLHLLSLGRLCAEQGAAGENQVLTLRIVLFVNEEVLLLRADRCSHAANILAEQFKHAACLRADGFHRTQQRGLFVENFAGIRAERRRNIERTVLDERIAGGVPRGIAAGLEGRAQTAGRERRGIRLALNQFLAGKLHHYAAVIRGGNKGIVLFRRHAGHWLEPVGVVCCAFGHRPVLHRRCHYRSNVSINGRTFPHGFLQLSVNVLGQTFLHHGLVKDHAAEQLRNILCCVHEWFAPLYVNLLPNEWNITKQALRVVFPQRLCC